MAVWGLCPSTVQGQSSWGLQSPEADDTIVVYCENMRFCHGFKNDIAKFDSLPTNVQYETEDKSI